MNYLQDYRSDGRREAIYLSANYACRGTYRSCKKLIAELEASEESVGNYPAVVSGILTDMTGLSEVG